MNVLVLGAGGVGGYFGGPTEGEHIIGDLLRRARSFGLVTPPLRIANAHLQTYDAERAKS